jgi:hypothetical protein
MDGKNGYRTLRLKIELLILISIFVTAFLLGGSDLAALPSDDRVKATSISADRCTVLVDTLGAADSSDSFSVFGSGGLTIASAQIAGPRIILTERTTIHEIGAFLNNCKGIVQGVPLCPVTLPFLVEIHPAENGVPDPSIVLASFELSHDDDPLEVSFESVATDLTLEPGTYFALFVPQGDDVGFLLSSTGGYQADLATLGLITTFTTPSFIAQLFAAVRVLGDCTIPVLVDVKPGSSPNSVNPRSGGVIPVAILTTEAFDATTVDPSTVRFGATGTGAVAVHDGLEDVDFDGDLDLILHFRTEQTGIVCGTTSVALTGETDGGEPIEGSDSVRTVGCPKG